MQRKKYIYLYMKAQTRKFWQDITITWFQPCAFNRVYVWFIHGNYVWWAMNLQKKHGQMKEEPYWKPTTWILRADSRNESQWLICNYKLHTGISQCARTSFKCKPHWTWNLKTTTTSTKKNIATTLSRSLLRDAVCLLPSNTLNCHVLDPILNKSVQGIQSVKGVDMHRILEESSCRAHRTMKESCFRGSLVEARSIVQQRRWNWFQIRTIKSVKAFLLREALKQQKWLRLGRMPLQNVWLVFCAWKHQLFYSQIHVQTNWPQSIYLHRFSIANGRQIWVWTVLAFKVSSLNDNKPRPRSVKTSPHSPCHSI